jgi:hypothetical protein
MVIWFLRRSPPLWKRIARMTLVMGSAAGVAIGAEILRRKLGIGAPRVSVARNGGTTRVRVSMARSRTPRRRRRAVPSGSQSRSE